MNRSSPLLASLRYRRPYWMLFLRGVDNWKIYTVIHQPEHQRTEMMYQAWLGGLDRPYTRPKCMAHQPLWLQKRRHELKKNRLDGAETTLERYVLEWYRKYFSFAGKDRPEIDELHTVFDLVVTPLDLSYACQLLRHCRNRFNVRLSPETFLIFLEACLRVDRRDVAQYGLENADTLGFPLPVPEDCRKYLEGQQTYYSISQQTGEYLPLEENVERNAAVKAKAGTTDGTEMDDEIAKLQAELEALEKSS
jgi:hypothetical protein